MPLVKGKSKKAFDENMRTEVKAKEEQGYSAEKAAKIAAAIAFATKRKAARDRGKK